MNKSFFWLVCHNVYESCVVFKWLAALEAIDCDDSEEKALFT